jgi:hypothetical protein
MLFSVKTATVLAIVAVCVCGVPKVSAQGAADAGRFSAMAPGGLPAGWTPLTFRSIESHTRYALVGDGAATVLQADSKGTASGLVRRFADGEVDLRATPILRWRWKVSNLVQGADIRRKDGDDYPARVYVLFRYDPARASLAMRAQYALARSLHGEALPHATLNYVWDGKAPAGTMLPNAYTGRAMMLVVESGAARVGQWVEAERNVLEDYRRAFGEDPPPVSGVAVMTDTDQTGEAVTAWYGDIAFGTTLQVFRLPQ